MPREYHTLANRQSFRKSRADKGPPNKDPPGLVNKKDKPPVLAEDKKEKPKSNGKKKETPEAIPITQEVASTTSQASLSETVLALSDNPPSLTAASVTSPAPIPASISTSPPEFTPSVTPPPIVATSSPTSPPDFTSSVAPPPPPIVTTSSSPDLTPASIVIIPIAPTLPTNFGASSIPAIPRVSSLTTAEVSASSDGFFTSTKYSISESPSSTLSATLYPETTMRTSFISTSSMTAMQTGIVNNGSSSTAQTDYNATSPGQKAGIAVGTLSAFGFFVALILYFFKRRRAASQKAMPCPERCLPLPWGRSFRHPYHQTPDAMPAPLLVPEVGSRDNLAWDYQATFARPTIIERARRSIGKSLTGLGQINPLKLNPNTPQAQGIRTPNRRSFASFFHRRSVASSHQSDLRPSHFEDSVTDPQSPPPLPPPYSASPFPRPVTMPPSALQRPLPRRNSQITTASKESKAHSFKSIPEWVKFHYPRGSQKGAAEVHRESQKTLPSLPNSPSSWLNIFRRSHTTTSSEDEGGPPHRASGISGKSAGSKRAVFWVGGLKQAQRGPRISGASVPSLAVEKQEAGGV